MAFVKSFDGMEKLTPEQLQAINKAEMHGFMAMALASGQDESKAAALYKRVQKKRATLEKAARQILDFVKSNPAPSNTAAS